MKKKILVVSIAVALLAVLAVSGSLAWFSDTDEITNTFTIGSIKIQQVEKQDLDNDGQYEDFVQDQYLLPVADPQNPTTDDNYREKIVWVESNGANDAYVRTHIAVPTALKDIVNLDISDSNKWVAADTTTVTTVDGISYTVYTYTYTDRLPYNTQTDILLEGVWMDAEVDMKETEVNGVKVDRFCTWNATTNAYDFYDYDVTKPIYVLVATQGCQADGFDTAADALDTVFPKIPDFTVVTP